MTQKTDLNKVYEGLMQQIKLRVCACADACACMYFVWPWVCGQGCIEKRPTILSGSSQSAAGNGPLWEKLVV